MIQTSGMCKKSLRLYVCDSKDAKKGMGSQSVIRAYGKENKTRLWEGER
jgi:hypothetical protein